MNKITEICDSFKGNTTGALAIVNEAGEKTYLNSSSTSIDIQNLDMKELTETAEQYSESTFRTRLDGTEYFVTKKKMKSTGWNLVHIVPQSWMLADMWKISMLIVAAVAGTGHFVQPGSYSDKCHTAVEKTGETYGKSESGKPE